MTDEDTSLESPTAFVVWPITARQALKARRKRAPGRSANQAEGLHAEAGLEAETMVQVVFPDETGDNVELLGPDCVFHQETDLDRGLREGAARLPMGEVSDKDATGEVRILRWKVLEALLGRGRFRKVWRRLPLDALPWELRDCPNPRGEQVPTLAYGLESIVELKGKIVPLALLPLKFRRAFRLVAQLDDLDQGVLPAFVPPWRDEQLRDLALQRSCRFYSSTSSLTGLLSKCYFAISCHRGVDLVGLNRHFWHRPNTYAPSTRWPTIVYLRRSLCGSSWSISAAPETHDEEDDNVLSHLGLTMEYQVKMSKEDFDARFRKCSKGEGVAGSDAAGRLAAAEEEEATAYRYLEVGPFMMRSQLDARHENLIFDLKTRAVAPIRYDIQNWQQDRSYRIEKLTGRQHSYELEIYDMMRLAFLKYGFQARIGRMDGVFVTYHNTAEIFGFQYIPLADMDRCLYGSREAALVAFDLSTKTLDGLMRLLTEDSALAQTGTIKMMLTCDDDACNGRGNALDVAAAPVEAADTEREAVGIPRRWRVIVEAEGPDGAPHPVDEPLQEGVRVHLTVNEVFVELQHGEGFGVVKRLRSLWDALKQMPGRFWRGDGAKAEDDANC